MKLADVPACMIAEFEKGYVPMDAPPGLEEMAYKAWKDAGGTVKGPTPEPAVWACVELMGHVKLAGRLTEEEKFGAKLGRLDIPQEDGSFVTQFFGGSSVYRITLVTEDVARVIARKSRPEPVHPWDFPKQLAAGERQTPISGHSLPDDDDDRDDDEVPFE